VNCQSATVLNLQSLKLNLLNLSYLQKTLGSHCPPFLRQLHGNSNTRAIAQPFYRKAPNLSRRICYQLFPSYSPSKIDTNSTIWNAVFSNAECRFWNEIYGRAALPCRPNQIAVRRPFTYAACLDVTQTIIFFFFWSRRLRSNRASGRERVSAGVGRIVRPKCNAVHGEGELLLAEARGSNLKSAHSAFRNPHSPIGWLFRFCFLGIS
jgi:hypothetical protein